ncbi:MAG: YciI family protein [Myxococcota bacterium]
MKYMLMMNTGSGPYQIAEWPPEDIKAHIQFMRDFARQLTESGELVAAEGLAGPDQARRVRADSDGKPITDGIFPETKEFLAGYWLVEVASTEQAYEIAARASAAPGPGGEPLNMAIEVREVLSGPPPEMLE